MHLKVFFVLAAAVTLAFCQSDCEWRYRCCKMTDDGCEELCEPEIVCPEEESTTEFDINNYQIQTSNMIGVGCKNGFKMANNKCKKVFK